MGKLRLVLLVLLLGCTSVVSTGIPETNEEWAIRCLRIAEDNQPNKEQRFETCRAKWRDWRDKQTSQAR